MEVPPSPGGRVLSSVCGEELTVQEWQTGRDAIEIMEFMLLILHRRKLRPRFTQQSMINLGKSVMQQAESAAESGICENHWWQELRIQVEGNTGLDMGQCWN